VGRFGFVTKRLGRLVPLLLGITLVVFLMLKITPGDPARTVAGLRAPQSELVRVRHNLGLDQPVYVQYWRYLGRVSHGDFGSSIRSGASVASIIKASAPVTLWLIIGGTVFAVLLAVPLAVISAVRPDGVVDHIVRGVSLFSLTMPPFWIGIMLILLVAIPTGWFPVGGYGQSAADHARSLFLPALTLGIAIAPLVVRSLRASMISVLDSDYVAAARCAGLSGGGLILRFAMRNAVPPAVTILAAQVGFLLFGSVLVENTFDLPGLGQQMGAAVSYRDFPVIQGVTLVFAVVVVLVYLAADVVLALLDPRVELQ
jgi:peptide/nickel transport system permease protein